MSFEQPRNFDKIKSMTFDELTTFLESTTNEDSPWIEWFNESHCANCDTIMGDDSEFSYCELMGRCKFFEDLATDKDIIKIWLAASSQ